MTFGERVRDLHMESMARQVSDSSSDAILLPASVIYTEAVSRAVPNATGHLSIVEWAFVSQ